MIKSYLQKYIKNSQKRQKKKSGYEAKLWVSRLTANQNILMLAKYCNII